MILEIAILKIIDRIEGLEYKLSVLTELYIQGDKDLMEASENIREILLDDDKLIEEKL